MVQHDPEMMALIVFLASAIAGSAIQFAIQREVNRALPKSQRLPYFQWGRDYTRQLRILRLHRELYPGDSLPTLYWLFMGLSLLAFVCMVLSSTKRGPT
jgi:hypothetical protein